MRTILFFDLPSVTNKDKKIYRGFVKNIKKLGFYMIQESVYVKMSIDSQTADSTIAKVKLIAPSVGNIMTLNVTEKQFASINIIIGESKTDVLVTDERIVTL